MSMWQEFVKSSPGAGGSQYKPYDDKLCIIVYPYGDIALTKETYKQLGYPTHVVAVTNGINCGFVSASALNPNAFKIGGIGQHRQRLSCKAFTSETKLSEEGKINIWKGAFRDGALAFDVSKGPEASIPHVVQPYHRRKK